MIELRPYQVDAYIQALDALERKRSCLIVAPTGSGKTEIMIELLNELQGSKLVITKKVSLVRQTAERFTRGGLSPTIYCASLNEKRISRLTIASVDSVFRVASESSFDYLVFDEVHNLSDDEDSRFYQTVSTLVEKGSKLIGFTATPYRAKSGNIYGDESKFFDQIDFEITFHKLIEEGYLVRPTLKCTQESFDTSGLRVTAGEWNAQDVESLALNQDKAQRQVKEALLRLEGRKKVFWQTSSIKHCELIKNILISEHGELASCVHSENPRSEAERLLFEDVTSNVRHCVFVTMLSEGYNYEPASALVLLRPTRSPVLYVQTVGRVLRKHQDKQDALVLDFGRVVELLGPIDKPRVAGPSKVSRKEEATLALVWTCKKCLCYNPKEAVDCEDCGAPKVEVKKDNTTEKPSDATFGEIISLFKTEQVFEQPVDRVVVSTYKAKSGNDCIKISYFPKTDFMIDRSIDEYFVRTEFWALIRARKRLKELGFKDIPDLSKPVLAIRQPSSVQFTYESKYKRIKGLTFRESDRA